MFFLSSLLFNAVESNCVTTVNQLIDVLKIKVSKTTSREILEEHPNYPSLLSISDALNSWKVSNLSITTIPGKLKDFPTPFIVQISPERKKYFAVVKELKDDYVILSDIGNKKWNKMPLQGFIDIWTGVMMLVEVEERAGEKGFKVARKKDFTNKIVPISAISLVIGVYLAESITLFIQNGFLSLA